jgi:hypothetical protein
MSGLSVVGRDYYGGKIEVIVSLHTLCCVDWT